MLGTLQSLCHLILTAISVDAEPLSGQLGCNSVLIPKPVLFLSHPTVS